MEGNWCNETENKVEKCEVESNEEMMKTERTMRMMRMMRMTRTTRTTRM